MTFPRIDLRPNGPAPIQSTLSDRSPERLRAVVDQFRVTTAERYRKRDVTGDGIDETFCNFFARDVSEAMNAALPQGYRANELEVWLGSKFGKAAGFEHVSEHVAQAAANEGMLAFAIWRNPTGRAGHIAVLVPAGAEPGTWIAQAGMTNFTRGALKRGFGTVSPILFFVHA